MSDIEKMAENYIERMMPVGASRCSSDMFQELQKRAYIAACKDMREEHEKLKEWVENARSYLHESVNCESLGNRKTCSQNALLSELDKLIPEDGK